MKYYNLLDLGKEPFSNSPDPDFLFLSKQHEEGLHQIKLAITLRRGLNVLVGAVGTGKTTLCRQLIKDLGKMEDGTRYSIHLFLESDFASSLEFLHAVTRSLGMAPTSDSETERDLKEGIKQHLFDTGLKQEGVVVLIFDEGQKLPACCLEVIRELLNFETNNSKLIQVVIFAQEEFLHILERLPDFSDRVNSLIRLEALSFRDTRAMIRHRLREAGDSGAPGNQFFGFLHTFLIHLISKGYPRKIVMLCSKIMIALIVRNRKKASSLLVLESARRLPFGRDFLIGAGRFAGVSLCFLLTGILFLSHDWSKLFSPAWITAQWRPSVETFSPHGEKVVPAGKGKEDGVAGAEMAQGGKTVTPGEAYGYSDRSRKAADRLAVIEDDDDLPGMAWDIMTSTTAASLSGLAYTWNEADHDEAQLVLIWENYPGKYPHSSFRPLTEADLDGLALSELKLMRNEIYARHSYIFSSDFFASYFRGKNWYKPREKDVSGMLSHIEMANIALIRKQELKLSGAEHGSK